MNMPSRRWLALMALVALAGISAPVFAADILNDTTNLYRDVAFKFEAAVVSYGLKLLWILGGLQLGLDAYRLVIKHSEMGEIIEKFVALVMTLGLFTFFIQNVPTLMPSLLTYFDKAGQVGSGLTHLSPSAIIAQGIDVVGVITHAYSENQSSIDKINPVMIPVQALQVFFFSLIFFVAFVVLAYQMVLNTVQTYLWIAVLPLTLGFAGVSYTRDMAISSVKAILPIGMKMLVSYLLAAVAGDLAPSIGKAVADAGPLNPGPLLEAAGAALIFGLLAWNLPKMAADLLNGTASLSAGDAIKGAVMAGAGMAAMAVGAGAAAKAVGGVAGATAMQATGVAKALGAGVEAAGDVGKSGIAAVGHAIGAASSHGLGMATSAIGDKVGGAAGSFAAGVDNTVGGRIASSIEASRGGSMAGVPPPSTPDSGPAGPAQSPTAAAAPGEPPSSTAAQAVSAGGPSGSANSPSSAIPGSAAAAASGGDAGQIPRGTGAAAAPGAPAQSPAPSGPPGSASTASISGGDGARDGAAVPPPQDRPHKSALHERIRDLQGYIPDDGHTVAVAANITHKLD